MATRVIIGVLLVLALGISALIALDPSSRAAATQLWHEARAAFGGGTVGQDADGLLTPITRAFKSFADSVGGLWSGTSIQIQVPSIQVPH